MSWIILPTKKSDRPDAHCEEVFSRQEAMRNWNEETSVKGLPDYLQAFLGLQKVFYPGKNPQEYYLPSLGGENASYRKPPWWLWSDDFID